MSNKAHNEAAIQLWEQVFERLANSEFATIIDDDTDNGIEDQHFREALTNAGWNSSEIEARINFHNEELANAPVTSPGVNPFVESHLDRICTSVEEAMRRLHVDSASRAARGVEPRTDHHASMINVIMTDQNIITVGSFFFRFCGLIARAFTRTLQLQPWLWEAPDYNDQLLRDLLRANPRILSYWMTIYLSFAATGTHALTSFRPASKREVILFEQVARAMEIFSVAHEFGHHHHRHGGHIESDSKLEEFEADQFALKICYEVERFPVIFQNPYLASGAGGVIVLMASDTLKKIKALVIGKRTQPQKTHPETFERLKRFDSVACLTPSTFSTLKGFRTASARIMGGVDNLMTELFDTIPHDVISDLQHLAKISREPE
ncbi:hypothetical protein [Magnetovibrio sp.]|uniref:hypothetical protein n=1 Tax=Magnetovibrio sp. TaxID=2024836 RepID=UPI002F94E186